MLPCDPLPLSCSSTLLPFLVASYSAPPPRLFSALSPRLQFLLPVLCLNVPAPSLVSSFSPLESPATPLLGLLQSANLHSQSEASFLQRCRVGRRRQGRAGGQRAPQLTDPGYVKEGFCYFVLLLFFLLSLSQPELQVMFFFSLFLPFFFSFFLLSFLPSSNAFSSCVFYPSCIIFFLSSPSLVFYPSYILFFLPFFVPSFDRPRLFFGEVVLPSFLPSPPPPPSNRPGLKIRLLFFFCFLYFSLSCPAVAVAEI